MVVCQRVVDHVGEIPRGECCGGSFANEAFRHRDDIHLNAGLFGEVGGDIALNFHPLRLFFIRPKDDPLGFGRDFLASGGKNGAGEQQCSNHYKNEDPMFHTNLL